MMTRLYFLAYAPSDGSPAVLLDGPFMGAHEAEGKVSMVIAGEKMGTAFMFPRVGRIVPSHCLKVLQTEELKLTEVLK